MLQANLSTSTDFSTEPEIETIGYDEAVSGDISNDPANPLALPLTEGRTILSATTTDGDQEYVTVTIPEGLQLDALVLESYSNDNAAFVGVQEGDTFTEPLDESADPGNLLGYALFGGRARTGEDFLDDISNGRDTQGFRGALPSGDYTFAFQQLNVESSYTVAFEVSEVATEPEREANYEWDFDNFNDDFPDTFTGRDSAVTGTMESLAPEDSNSISEAGQELLNGSENNYLVFGIDSGLSLTMSEGNAIADDPITEQFWDTEAEFLALGEAGF
ncbi:MAG TPA: hypothetical protein ACFCUY_00660 [Xenococcaceae cyanobacterium]